MSIPSQGQKEGEGYIGRWEELPFEVVERFLGYVNVRKDLLSSRCVSRMWRDAASSVMERRCYAIATTWNSNDGICELFNIFGLPSPLQTFPELTLVAEQGLSQAFYPKGTTPLPRGFNPFITKSLVLKDTDFGIVEPGASKKAEEQKRLSIYTLLLRHGDCLTSLQIFRVTTDPMQLYKLLEQIPNLKALRLHDILFKGKETEAPLPLISASPVPCLTHVVLRVHKPTINQWLLNLLGPQVTTIDFVCTEGILPFNQTNYMTTIKKGSKPFQNLKNLKVMDPGRDFVLNTGVDFSWPLERIFLDFTWPVNLSVDNLVQFITRFGTSLKDLHFNSSICRDVNQGTAKSSKNPTPVTFPKLLKLDFTMVNLETFELIKSHLLPHCTKLQTLRLKVPDSMLFHISRGCNREWDFFEQKMLWNLCPDLKGIEVADSLEVSGNRVFTIQLRDRMQAAQVEVGRE